jgi:hypothetical protein
LERSLPLFYFGFYEALKMADFVSVSRHGREHWLHFHFSPLFITTPHIKLICHQLNQLNISLPPNHGVLCRRAPLRHEKRSNSRPFPTQLHEL